MVRTAHDSVQHRLWQTRSVMRTRARAWPAVRTPSALISVTLACVAVNPCAIECVSRRLATQQQRNKVPRTAERRRSASSRLAVLKCACSSSSSPSTGRPWPGASACGGVARGGDSGTGAWGRELGAGGSELPGLLKMRLMPTPSPPRGADCDAPERPPAPLPNMVDSTDSERCVLTRVSSAETRQSAPADCPTTTICVSWHAVGAESARTPLERGARECHVVASRVRACVRGRWGRVLVQPGACATQNIV